MFFSCVELPSFCALSVAMFAVAGCVYKLESVFFLNVEVFGVSDSLGERIRNFSVGNVELIFNNWFRLAKVIEFIDPRVKFGKQECGSLRHITLNPR